MKNKVERKAASRFELAPGTALKTHQQLNYTGPNDSDFDLSAVKVVSKSETQEYSGGALQAAFKPATGDSFSLVIK